MDLSYDFTVHAECATCPEGYDVPASLILESQALLELGCPGTSPLECVPAFYAALADRATLDSWARAQASARQDERALARWDDDGGAARALP